MQVKQYIGNKFRNLTLNSYPGLYRPDSSPFISGDTFRKFSDHIFDETKTLDPKKVKKNDIVFLRTDLKDIYFKHYHQKILEPYIVLMHNSDDSFEEKDISKIDEKIIHCFSQNLNIEKTKKISPLPIGFENHRFRNNGKVDNLKKASKFNNFKKQEIFSSFNVNTNLKIRLPIMNTIRNNDNITFGTYDDNLEYLEELSRFKFNLCPSGNGLDTHRVWESLLVNTYPIVHLNNTNINLYNMGVPLILQENLEDISESIILKIIEQNILKKNPNNEKFITFHYWRDLISSKKI